MSKLAKDQLKFVDPLGDEFDCPICLEILQEPYLTACCGNHFCEACVERVKKGANTCPLCQETPLSGMINKSLRRKLNELKVYCVHKEIGCKWIDDLGKLEQHLATGKNDGECQFVMVRCTISDLCKVKFLRNALKNHINNTCQYRQFKCEHCSYQSTYLVIITEHYFDQCPHYPVSCPNNCSKETETHPRSQLDTHLASCPEQEVDCIFSEMGCKEKVKRRQLQEHLTTNSLQHQLIMCQAYHLQNETIAQLQQDKRKLEEQVACLTDKCQILAMPVILEIPLIRVNTKRQMHLGFHSFAPKYYSLPFYSYPSGYKLQLSVNFICQDSKYMAGYISGFLSTRGTLANKVNGMIYAACIDLHTVAGEYDDILKWPLEGKISITMLNKQTNNQHHKIEKYFKGNKTSKLMDKNTNTRPLSDIKKEYEQLVKERAPTKLQSQLCNMFYDTIIRRPSNSLLFFLDDDLLGENKESNVYFEVVFS